ncbi:MAG: hypothetical protein ACRBCT_05165 [Alphaproteobacteria bacterium]
MFSDYAKNTGATPPRHAEYSDTRHAIHRQDTDWNRKKQKNAEQNNQNLDSDSAMISVDAAILFLKNLLEKSAQEKPDHNQTPNETAQNATTRLNALSKPHAHYAAHAYAHAAEITPTQRQRNAARNYARDRLRLVISHFETIKRNGIKEIHVERGEDFLTSMENAAQNALIIR